MRRPRPRLLALCALAAVPPAIEAVLLVHFGFVAAEGLSSQVTAVWPYDSYHDLRWLYVYHDSWPEFLVGLLLLIVFRGLLTTGLVALAWPAEAARPGLRWLLGRNLALSAVVTVLVSPWALISVAASVVALSWVLLASLLPMFLLAPFLQRAAVVEPWWRGLPSIALVGWSLLNFVVITVAGALCWSVPGWWTVPVAALAGIANGLLWERTVHVAVLTPRVRWARVPATPIAVLLALAVPLAIPLLVQIVPTGVTIEQVVLGQRLLADVRHAVIVLAGHSSAYDGTPPVDANVERFSYPRAGRGRPAVALPAGGHRPVAGERGRAVGDPGGPAAPAYRSAGRPDRGERGAMLARTYLRSDRTWRWTPWSCSAR